MIIGMRVLKCVLLFLVLFNWILGTARAGDDRGLENKPEVTREREWTLDQLHQLLSKHERRYADFEEIHFSNFLTEPVKLSGTLIYVAPSKIEKHVTAPYEERYSVDGDVVFFENRAKGISRTVSLEGYPLLRAFVDGLRATFAGDFKTLAKYYHLQLDGDQNRWVLTLVPIEERLRDIIESITIQGQEDRLKQLDLRETTGDYSRMRIKATR